MSDFNTYDEYLHEEVRTEREIEGMEKHIKVTQTRLEMLKLYLRGIKAHKDELYEEQLKDTEKRMKEGTL